MGHGFGIVKEFTKETFGGLRSMTSDIPQIGYESSMKPVKGYIQTPESGGIMAKLMGEEKDYRFTKGDKSSTEISYFADNNVKSLDGGETWENNRVAKGNTIGGAGEMKQMGRKAAAGSKNFLKDVGKGALFSGAMYGLGAYATDNADNDMSDRLVNTTKYGAAFAADVAGDTLLTGVAKVAGMFGPTGRAVGAAITAFNFGSNLLGIDAGSMLMHGWDHAEDQYYKVKEGPKFDMTGNKSQAMQRQIQNLHASGSNLGEMMHN